MKYNVFINQYEKSLLVRKDSIDINTCANKAAVLLDGACRIEASIISKPEHEQYHFYYRFTRSVSTPSNVGFEIEIDNWKKENYVFVPAAAYNGNRFDCKILPYAPYITLNKTEALNSAAVITDIPHLSIDEPVSIIQLRSGDMSTPAVGYYDEHNKQGFLLISKHFVGRDYTGFIIIEDLVNHKAKFAISAPAVREEVKYFFGERKDGSGFYPDSHTATDDLGKCFEEGDNITLSCSIYSFSANTLSEYFAYFNQVRSSFECGNLSNTVPFYVAYQAIKEKYQEENYNPEGYYSVGVNYIIPQQCWQAGWIGGGMNNYSFLLEDRQIAYDRSLNTFRFILDKLQNENGWVCGVYSNGIFYGDNFELDKPGSILLVRKNADLLYFLLKELILLNSQEKPVSAYTDKIANLADAFVRLYKKYGQLGQFIDIETEEILTGNSASAAMAVGALALAYTYYNNKVYLDTAKKLGEYYYKEYLQKGILNGCPGEICQAPDSEAAFALLESYVQLYETTNEDKWLSYAKETFELCITWVMSYDFKFPDESTAAKLNVHTIGTIFANVQNKHSAPGICTLSGNSILKLYRFTKDQRYLKWLYYISHSLTQFVSLKNRPIFTLEKTYLPSGYMNERVQTSDWEGKETIGEFLNGSNWPEVSMLLTYVEIPSIYLDFSNGLVQCFDHIKCNVMEQSEDTITLELNNETEYDTYVTVLVDESEHIDHMKHNYFDKMVKIFIRANQRKIVTYHK